MANIGTLTSTLTAATVEKQDTLIQLLLKLEFILPTAGFLSTASRKKKIKNSTHDFSSIFLTEQHFTSLKDSNSVRKTRSTGL